MIAMIQALMAELVGTFVFFICVLASAGDPIVIGIGLIAAIYALGKVSGGHFNPMITVMKYIKQDIDVYKLLIYISAQLIGGVLALLFFTTTIEPHHIMK